MKAAMYYSQQDIRIEEVPVPEIDDDDGLGPELFAERKKFVVAEVVGDFVPEVTGADGTLGLSSRHIINHVAPIQKINVSAARESNHGYFHFRQKLQHARLKLARSVDACPLDANLAPAWPFHELAEHSRIDPVLNGRLYAKFNSRRIRGRPLRC